MNYSRLITTSVAVFVFALLWNSVVHGVILREANAVLEGITRASGDRNMALALLLTAGLAFLFVWSYARVARRGTVREGLVHGLFFAALAGLLVNLNQYILYPVPASLALTWFIFGVFEFCGYGILTSWLYPVRKRERATSSIK